MALKTLALSCDWLPPLHFSIDSDRPLPSPPPATSTRNRRRQSNNTNEIGSIMRMSLRAVSSNQIAGMSRAVISHVPFIWQSKIRKRSKKTQETKAPPGERHLVSFSVRAPSGHVCKWMSDSVLMLLLLLLLLLLLSVYLYLIMYHLKTQKEGIRNGRDGKWNLQFSDNIAIFSSSWVMIAIKEEKERKNDDNNRNNNRKNGQKEDAAIVHDRKKNKSERNDWNFVLFYPNFLSSSSSSFFVFSFFLLVKLFRRDDSNRIKPEREQEREKERQKERQKEREREIEANVTMPQRHFGNERGTLLITHTHTLSRRDCTPFGGYRKKREREREREERVSNRKIAT